MRQELAAVITALLALAACAVRETPVHPGANAPVAPAAIQASPPPKARTEAATCSVDLYGDSIMHGGYGGHFRLDEPPAATLKRLRPHYTVQDHSRNGETATQRAKAFESELRTGRFVVIAYGINDAIQRLPLEPSLRPMIGTLRREGREVILTGLSQQAVSIPGRAAADQTIRRLASEFHVPFVDWGAVRYVPQEMADVLHPSKPYSDRLVGSIIHVLDQLAPECA